MNEPTNSIPRLRYEKVDKLIELINQRELATSEAQYNAETEDINKMFSLIKCPVPTTFAARLERQRQPWVRIVDALLAEIARGAYKSPFKFDQEECQDVLMIRTSDAMTHFGQGFWEKRGWPDMSALSDRVLKKQLKQAGVLIVDSLGNAKSFERTLGGKRVGHLTALRLSELHAQGLGTFAATQAVYAQSKP